MAREKGALAFSASLNRFIADTGCSAKDLARASGLSAAAISRYRSGERTPDADSKQLHMLARGIAEQAKGVFDEQAVFEELSRSISGIGTDYQTFLANLTTLLSALGISNNELARELSFDPSYISRILSGQRRPADFPSFVTRVSNYAARKCPQGETSNALNILVNESLSNRSESDKASIIAVWLGTHRETAHNSSVGIYLKKLDEFDLDAFSRAIRFDEMKAPLVPFQLPTTKYYEGIWGLKECELDFLRATALSRSSEDVIMFSDMPLGEAASDAEFAKKRLYGTALLLKKALKLHVIHNVHRSVKETMQDLGDWIPLYMTGQIEPYYFVSAPDSVFSHILNVSGSAAMQVESIVGHQADCRCTLTKNWDEVRYYRKRARQMLEKARPLMRIITAENADELDAFEKDDATIPGKRHIITSAPPIGCIPSDLLARMLERAGVGNDEQAAICAFAARRAKQLEAMLAANEVMFTLPAISQDEFDEHPILLNLSGMFREKAIPYEFGEFAEHLEALRQFAISHKRCMLVIKNDLPFRNVQASISEGRNVLISKNTGPCAHLIVEYPAVVTAFEQFSMLHAR